MVHGPEDTIAFRLWPPVGSAGPSSSAGWSHWSGVIRSTSAVAGSARLGAGAVLRRVERLVAVVVRPAPDRAAAGAGDEVNHRGGTLPRLPQPVVRRPAGVLPRAGIAGTHPLGTCAVPGRGAARPAGARSVPRNSFCTTGSERRTTITRGECVVGCDGTTCIFRWDASRAPSSDGHAATEHRPSQASPFALTGEYRHSACALAFRRRMPQNRNPWKDATRTKPPSARWPVRTSSRGSMATASECVRRSTQCWPNEVLITGPGRRRRTPPPGHRLHGRQRCASGPRPQYGREIEVTILDLADNLASVKVVSEPFVDYLHLAKFEGRWWIVNVLYQDRQS